MKFSYFSSCLFERYFRVLFRSQGTLLSWNHRRAFPSWRLYHLPYLRLSCIGGQPFPLSFLTCRSTLHTRFRFQDPLRICRREALFSARAGLKACTLLTIVSCRLRSVICGRTISRCCEVCIRCLQFLPWVHCLSKLDPIAKPLHLLSSQLLRISLLFPSFPVSWTMWLQTRKLE